MTVTCVSMQVHECFLLTLSVTLYQTIACFMPWREMPLKCFTILKGTAFENILRKGRKCSVFFPLTLYHTIQTFNDPEE